MDKTTRRTIKQAARAGAAEGVRAGLRSRFVREAIAYDMKLPPAVRSAISPAAATVVSDEEWVKATIAKRRAYLDRLAARLGLTPDEAHRILRGLGR